MQEATVTRRAQPPRVALVLGSGGIKSIASLGLFRVLAREKIPIDLIAASSGGRRRGSFLIYNRYTATQGPVSP